MKYKYCPSCKKAYIKSRLEKDQCIYCNATCETVNVRRSGLYYFGYAITVAGAISAFVPRFVEVSGTTFYYAMGVMLFIAGAVLVMMASVRMAQSAAEMAVDDNSSTSDDE